MSDVDESDRFECVVINIIKNLSWIGVTVEDLHSGGRVYFGKVKTDENDINVGDTLYLGARPIPYDLEEKEMEVSLYNVDNERIDWTLI
ncbi:MAG: hypothetical protein K0A90_05015 [Methanosarcinaceae archaeon]|nr:hypothetical protein [Methanosarcinaceae archaeon]MCL7411897.1 hypothetical protein [Methanosarcinaceae archaeon]MDO9518456.1 hypothetical protein [Methanosarcinaceae archaeon]